MEPLRTMLSFHPARVPAKRTADGVWRRRGRGACGRRKVGGRNVRPNSFGGVSLDPPATAYRDSCTQANTIPNTADSYPELDGTYPSGTAEPCAGGEREGRAESQAREPLGVRGIAVCFAGGTGAQARSSRGPMRFRLFETLFRLTGRIIRVNVVGSSPGRNARDRDCKISLWSRCHAASLCWVFHLPKRWPRESLK
jgi:hypothetical protein